MQPATHLARSVDGLTTRFTNRELLALVRERHPESDADMSDYQLFELTYKETHGQQLCETSHLRLRAEFEQFQAGDVVPLYFVRCLLPGYLAPQFLRGSA